MEGVVRGRLKRVGQRLEAVGARSRRASAGVGLKKAAATLRELPVLPEEIEDDEDLRYLECKHLRDHPGACSVACSIETVTRRRREEDGSIKQEGISCSDTKSNRGGSLARINLCCTASALPARI